MKVIFKKLKDCVGIYQNGVARIDLGKDANPGRTLIHEAIHHLYPKMKEADVLKWEKRIWRNLKQAERVDVYKQLISKRTNLIIRIVKEKIG